MQHNVVTRACEVVEAAAHYNARGDAPGSSRKRNTCSRKVRRRPRTRLASLPAHTRRVVESADVQGGRVGTLVEFASRRAQSRRRVRVGIGSLTSAKHPLLQLLGEDGGKLSCQPSGRAPSSPNTRGIAFSVGTGRTRRMGTKRFRCGQYERRPGCCAGELLRKALQRFSS